MDEGVTFPHTEAASLRHNVLITLRSFILKGKLRPGDRLMENEIARQMGVSRAPVREAVRQLEQEGLVESSPHRGTYVVDLPDEEIEQIYQARALLEGYAVRSAMQKMTGADLARLRVVLDNMRAAARFGNLDELAEQDLAFHEELMRLSGNRTIHRVWSSMFAIIRNWTNSVLRRSRRSDIIDWMAESHAPVMEALESGNAASAEEAVRQHILDLSGHMVAPGEDKKQSSPQPVPPDQKEVFAT